MSGVYAGVFLLALGVINLCVMVFVLPLLCGSTVCRVATLFAGLNVGILTTSVVVNDWAASGYIDQEDLIRLLLSTLPKIYVPSLAIGAVVIPKYVLLATTQIKAIIFGAIGIVALYFASLIVPNMVEALSFIYSNGPLTFELFWDLIERVAVRIITFERYSATFIAVSAFVAMVATTAIIQKTEHLNS